jgi:long-chain acyl-CoA synthetase
VNAARFPNPPHETALSVDAFLAQLDARGEQAAIANRDGVCTYAALVARVRGHAQRLADASLQRASVLLVDDYNVDSIAMLLALWLTGNVVALSVPKPDPQLDALAASAGCSARVQRDDQGAYAFTWRAAGIAPAAVARVLATREPGFIVFSSGSTGPAKGVVHRVAPFLDRYAHAEPCGALLAFLLFDHIGGLVTVLHALSTGGTLVIPGERTPHEVGRCIGAHRVETLHVSPTLLNLALSSGALRDRDLGSLRRVYYGTEPTSPQLLARVSAALPGVEMRQLYGMSEIGVLPCHGATDDGLWIRVDDPRYQLRVVDGILQVRGPTNLVGYLAGEMPLTDDGYFITADLADERDGHFRVTGRAADIINVGGKKVFPATVEAALKELADVLDVVVYGTPNPLLGQIVAARFLLAAPESLDSLRQRMYAHLKGVLSPEQIPRTVSISDTPLHTSRFKKMRHPDAAAPVAPSSTH